MANEKNLKPLNTRTKEEQREISKKGGIASGKSRREKKSMKVQLETIMSLPLLWLIQGRRWWIRNERMLIHRIILKVQSTWADTNYSLLQPRFIPSADSRLSHFLIEELYLINYKHSSVSFPDCRFKIPSPRTNAPCPVDRKMALKVVGRFLKIL